MIRLLLSVAGLTVVYALALASFAPADLAVGAVVSAALALSLRPLALVPTPGAIRGVATRAVALPAFAAVTAADVLTGAWDVALTILGVRPLRCSGIVAVPIGERTPAGLALTALTLTLSPGEVLVDVDRRHGVMLIQVLDGTDPDGVRRRHARRYELQRKVLP